MDPIEITEKVGVVLDEYQGKYSLKKMTLGKNGTWYPEWVFLSEWKDGGPVPSEKKRPMGTYLGDKATALKALAAIYHELKGDAKPASKEEPVQLPDEENLPF
jgi:hypothetical protein